MGMHLVGVQENNRNAPIMTSRHIVLHVSLVCFSIYHRKMVIICNFHINKTCDILFSVMGIVGSRHSQNLKKPDV